MPTKPLLAEERLIVVHFLLPVMDRNGKPYPRGVKKQVEHDLEELFDGWSRVSEKPLEGAWRNPDTRKIEYDKSWRYEIGIAPHRLEDVDDYLATLSHRLGQNALWRTYSEGGGRVIFAKAPADR